MSELLKAPSVQISQISVDSIIKERPTTFICLILLWFLYLFNFILKDPISIIGLVPINTIIANKYVWNPITSHFYERYFSKLLLDSFLLIATIKPFEIVSYEQFALYIIFSLLASSFCVSAISFISFFSSKLEETLIQPTYGFSGIYITLLTYLRQQYRNESIHYTFPLLTYQNLPIFYILIQLIFLIIGIHILSYDIYFSLFNLIFSWIYLRFFYKYKDDLSFGDISDEFAFVSMFPEVNERVIEF